MLIGEMKIKIQNIWNEAKKERKVPGQTVQLPQKGRGRRDRRIAVPCVLNVVG